MGEMNGTLAAFGGLTGGKDTNLTMTVAGKPFHLWTMRDPADSLWAAVYMDWGGLGPVDPFAQPPMVFSFASNDGAYSPSSDHDGNDDGGGGNGGTAAVQNQDCSGDAAAPDFSKIYFRCSFSC